MFLSFFLFLFVCLFVFFCFVFFLLVRFLAVGSGCFGICSGFPL